MDTVALKKQLTEQFEAIVTEEARHFLDVEGDNWKDFAKLLGKEYAQQVIKSKFGSEQDKATARENLEYISNTAATRVMRSALQLEGGVERVLVRTVKMGVKFLLAALL